MRIHASIWTLWMVIRLLAEKMNKQAVLWDSRRYLNRQYRHIKLPHSLSLVLPPWILTLSLFPFSDSLQSLGLNLDHFWWIFQLQVSSRLTEEVILRMRKTGAAAGPWNGREGLFCCKLLASDKNLELMEWMFFCFLAKMFLSWKIN